MRRERPSTIIQECMIDWKPGETKNTQKLNAQYPLIRQNLSGSEIKQTCDKMKCVAVKTSGRGPNHPNEYTLTSLPGSICTGCQFINNCKLRERDSS